MGFVRSLAESGLVPLCVDYRTGSADSLWGQASADTPTFVNAPQFVSKASRVTCSFRAGYIGYPNKLDQIFTSGTWMFLLPVDGNSFSTGRILCKRGVGGTAYDFYITKTGTTISCGYYNGIVNTILNYSGTFETVAWRHVGGSVPELFVNGSLVSSGASSSVLGTATEDIFLGAYYTGSSLLYPSMESAVVVADALSDSDIARLHRELIEGPTVVRRPSKHFSLPYPAKTPAQAAAEGLIIDLDCSRLEGRTIQDMSGSGYDAEANDHVTNQKGGPFVGSVGLYDQWAECPVASATKTFKDSYTISAWIKPRNLTAATLVVVGSQGNAYVGKAPGNSTIISYADSGGTQRTRVGPGKFVTGKWTNVCYILNFSSPDVTVGTFIDGVQDGATITLSGGMSLIGLRTLINAYNNAGLAPFDADYALVRYRDGVVFTAEQARAEYLEGARKCLLDARVHRDGSCPVSLEDVTAENELANGWKVQSGTWRVVEYAPSGGRPGPRWIQSQSQGFVAIPCESHGYGSWYARIKFNGVEHEWMFVAQQNAQPSDASQSGYGVHITSVGAVTIRERTAGASSTVVNTGITLVSDTEYEFWPTRRFDGLFELWIKGGSYTDWTSIGTGTDVTTETGGFQIIYANAADIEQAGCKWHLGEMTPEEAVSKGCLPNNRTET